MSIFGDIFGSSNTTTGTQSSTGSSTSAQQQQQQQQGQSTVTPNENPIFKMFRESILPAISKQYADAQKPVYGDQQVAQVVNNGNNVTNAALQGATGNMARRGILNGGAYNDASNQLNSANASNTTNFMNQIPLLNEQEKANRTNSLLGLATSFLGQSPIGSTTTGSSSGSSNSTGQQSGGQVTNTSQTQQSNPGILGAIGNLAGLATSFIPGFGMAKSLGSTLLGSIGGNGPATSQSGGF